MRNCVYRFLDQHGNILYVGKCKNLKTRLCAHIHNPHLPKEAYLDTHKIEYVSYPSYADAGIMERAFISLYEPKYNIQYTKEGAVTILSENSGQVFLSEWKLYADYPEGMTNYYRIQQAKTKLHGKPRKETAKRADFCIYINEEDIAEVYFFKIIKQANKPKSLKIQGAFQTSLVECSAYWHGEIECSMEVRKERCFHHSDFPKNYLQETEFKKVIDEQIRQSKTLIAYMYFGRNKYCMPSSYYVGDEKHQFRYPIDFCSSGKEEAFWYLAWALALSAVVSSGKLDEDEAMKIFFAGPEENVTVFDNSQQNLV